MNMLRIILASVIVLFVYGGANFYIARRLYQWLGLLSLNINVKVYTCIVIIFALSLFLGFSPLPSGIRGVFAWIGAYWIGIFVYLLIFTLVTDFAVLIGSITKLIPAPTPQSVLFYRGLATVLLTAGVVSYGLFNASQVRHVSYELQLGDTALGGMRVVLISDSHLGAINNFEKNLEKTIAAINDLTPDIVCIAGDIFNDDFYNIRDPNRASNLFRSIDATYGVFACLGNHDGGSTLPRMIEFLERSNVKLLSDEYVLIDDRLALFGRMDSRPIGGSGELRRRDITSVIASIGAELPVIVMEHNPSHIYEYGGEVDLILAGHTHKGQLFPGGLITRAMYTADYGHYQKDSGSPHVITTSGIGSWGPPMRVGTNNEIVDIVLR